VAGVISIFVAVELLLVGLCVSGGDPEQRRSHFLVRVLLAGLAMPALLALLLGLGRLNVLPDSVAKPFSTLAFFVGVMALFLLPGLLYHRPHSSLGPSADDGGGGPDPGQPRPSPDFPRGGVPLPNAEQASARARDHNRAKFQDLKQRRRAPDPRRTPVR
jgi:hypothetical protein